MNTEELLNFSGFNRWVYSDFFRLAHGLESGNIDLAKSYKDNEFGKDPLTAAKLDDSNVVTSRVGNGEKHRVAIDLDMDAVLVPSSTPGHHHLIIDKELSWEQYKKLLEALEAAGLIEAGYYKASINRGASVLRTPWTKKDLETRTANKQ